MAEPSALARLMGGKLGNDIAWTMGSVTVLASSGLVINLTIAGLKDTASLGVFNLAYAVYIVAAQVASFGLHYSVLRHAALQESEPDERGRLLVSAGLCALFFGLVFGLIITAGASALGVAFDSPMAGRTIAYTGFGLILFPLNKVLIAFLNGLRHMRAFAVLQSLRYTLVMAWIAIVCVADLPFETAGLAFLVAECTTGLGAIGYIVLNRLAPAPGFDVGWVVTHLKFGARSLFAGLMLEINSRIDVLLIGVFLPDRAVGIYSFAAMIFDGLYHILAMVRVNFNPVLVAAMRDRDWVVAIGLMSKSRRLVLPITVGVSAIAVGVFFIISNLILPDKHLGDGLASLLILLLGLTAVSALVPFDQLLVSSGFPGRQSIQYLTVLLSNVGMNLLMVPIWGIEGAAVATACALILGMGVLVIFSKQQLSWNLLTNRRLN